MDDLWGPWIEHDGEACPCVGAFVEVLLIVNDLGETTTRQAVASGGRSWFWAIHKKPSSVWQQVIRYRVRKPRGLIILESLIADLPAPTNPKVDA